MKRGAGHGLRLDRLGGPLGQSAGSTGRRYDTREAKIAIEADAGCESLASCGIERLRQLFYSTFKSPVARSAIRRFSSAVDTGPRPQRCRSKDSRQ